MFMVEVLVCLYTFNKKGFFSVFRLFFWLYLSARRKDKLTGRSGENHSTDKEADSQSLEGSFRIVNRDGLFPG